MCYYHKIFFEVTIQFIEIMQPLLLSAYLIDVPPGLLIFGVFFNPPPHPLVLIRTPRLLNFHHSNLDSYYISLP